MNLAGALALVDASASVVVCEDDDYYAPDWLAHCKAALDGGAEMYGEYGRTYYNARNRTFEKRINGEKPRGAAFGATAFAGRRARAIVDAVLSGDTDRPNPKLDVKVWAAARRHGLKTVLEPASRTVSIKGLPGRPGITGAHFKRLQSDDPNGEELARLVGADAAKAILGAAA